MGLDTENPIVQTEVVFGDALCKLYLFMNKESVAKIKAWHVPILHGHSFLEIMISGERGYRIDFENRSVRLPPHSLYMIPAGELHCAADTENMEKFSLGFSIEPIRGGEPAVFKTLSTSILLQLKEAKPVSRETEEIFKALYRCDGSSLRDVFQKKILAYNLVYGILRDLNIINDDPVLSGAKQTNFTAALETLLDRRKYRLEEIAQILGYSPKHMALLIKKQYGCDFRTLRREKIMEAAKIYLLSSQGMSIGEIADALGYKSESAFYAFFRQEVGCTPSEYRKRKMQEIENTEEIRYESK